MYQVLRSFMEHTASWETLSSNEISPSHHYPTMAECWECSQNAQIVVCLSLTLGDKGKAKREGPLRTEGSIFGCSVFAGMAFQSIMDTNIRAAQSKSPFGQHKPLVLVEHCRKCHKAHPQQRFWCRADTNSCISTGACPR